MAAIKNIEIFEKRLDFYRVYRTKLKLLGLEVEIENTVSDKEKALLSAFNH